MVGRGCLDQVEQCMLGSMKRVVAFCSRPLPWAWLSEISLTCDLPLPRKVEPGCSLPSPLWGAAPTRPQIQERLMTCPV